jgi:oligosaccharide 4-alpha-D-glucosyltransferase
MKLPLFLFLLPLFFHSVIYSQSGHAASKKFPASKGSFIVTQYRQNIYKISYAPATATPNYSDAVLLKAPVSSSYPFLAAASGDSVLIQGRAVITGIFDSGKYRGFFLPLKKDEKVFGGGERALPLDRKGYRLQLYNNPWYGYGEGADNLNYSVPFFTSSAGYGLFFDNPSRSYLDIGKADASIMEYGASSSELCVYVIIGNYQEVLDGYYRLTGTQPLPPRWAFGNLMSRFGYNSEAQVKNIYGKMKEAQVPVDAIIFDLFWFGDSIKRTMGNLDWINKKNWPDPAKMIAGFNREGVKTILVTEPFFVNTSKNYKSSLPYLSTDSAGKPFLLKDFYFGEAGLVDIFRKDARDWFWKFYSRQMRNGVEAWWGDLGEPEKHPSDLYHQMPGGKRVQADAVHNLYGHTWTKMLYDKYASLYPNKRLFSLNRSGFAGTQRFSIFPWTGDVSRSWEGLRAQLPVLLGMSMSGVPYVHSDAGGFAGGAGDPELYVRWLQFAVYTPIFRPHGTALYEIDTAAFSYPSEAALFEEPYRSIARESIRQRYHLLPYNYSLAWQQAKNRKPLMSPLYYYFGSDTTAASVEDEYMWGEGLLVAPVIRKGATIRTVYLPAGNWYELKGKKRWSGGWHELAVGLEEIPVFIREGSFVPVDTSTGKNTSKYDPSHLQVVYTVSSQPSFFELYHDDGVSKNAMQAGTYELLRFSSTGKKSDGLSLKITPVKTTARSAFRSFHMVIKGMDKKPAEVKLGQKLLKGWKYTSGGSPGEGTLEIELPYQGRAAEINIAWVTD